MITPILPMRKLKSGLQLPKPAREQTRVHLILLAPLRNYALRALITILPGEKADRFIQQCFSICNLQFPVSVMSVIKNTYLSQLQNMFTAFPPRQVRNMHLNLPLTLDS